MLKRRLEDRHRSVRALAHLGEPNRGLASAFSAAGFEPLLGPLGPEDLRGVARSFPDDLEAHVVLVMPAAEARALADGVADEGVRVAIWAPEPEPVRHPLATTIPVLEILGQSSVRTSALFAEWDAILEPLARRSLNPAYPAVREALRTAAELAGLPLAARVYGPFNGGWWDLDGAASPAAGDGAPYQQQLREDARELLLGPDAPETLVWLARPEHLPEGAEQLRARGIRLILAQPGTDEAPRAATPADVELPLDVLLLGAAVASLPETISAAGLAAASNGDVPAAEADWRAPRETPGGGPQTNVWCRLAYQIECLLRQHQWSRIGFRRLASELAAIEEFGPTPANALMWLNRAKAEGLLHVQQEPVRGEAGARMTTCRLRLEHPVSRHAVEVPDRCFRLLHQMLQKMPWVSFKLLRSVLLREQWLGGKPFRLDEAGVDEWLNFLIRDGALLMSKEPNVANPEFPVTALRLNLEHPMPRGVISAAPGTSNLHAERAILAVDHFLRRQRKPWMAMSALRRSLDGLGREELQEVLQGLQSLGALVTESYPNPQKEHFTTGCRLNATEPFVVEALNCRNTIVRVTQFHHRHRNWVPLARLDEELSGEHGLTAPLQQRLAWYLLLRDEGILELDGEAYLTPNSLEQVRCRLNVTDALVREIIADAHVEPEAARDAANPAP